MKPPKMKPGKVLKNNSQKQSSKKILNNSIQKILESNPRKNPWKRSLKKIFDKESSKIFIKKAPRKIPLQNIIEKNP